MKQCHFKIYDIEFLERGRKEAMNLIIGKFKSEMIGSQNNLYNSFSYALIKQMRKVLKHTYLFLDISN